MPNDPPFDVDSIALDEETVDLIVVWGKGHGFDGGEVRVGDEVADFLFDACETTLELMRGRDGREYSGDMHLEPEEFLYLSDETLVADSALCEIVLPVSPLQMVNARSLPRRRLLMYAAVVYSGAGDMLAFVRKTNPRTGTKAGALLTSLGNSLTRLDRPVFSLDDRFDFVVTEEGVIALDQLRFEQVFRDTPELQSRIPDWVAAIGSANHRFAADGAARLAARCQTDGRLRRRVRSIFERGHLESVTIAQIRSHIREAGLNEADFLTQDDELLVNDADPFSLVYLLNEDFFSGGLTSSAFRSDRKSPR